MRALKELKCECLENCLGGIGDRRIWAHYEELCKFLFGLQETKEENKFLLNVFMCILANTSVKWCGTAMLSLLKVSVGVVKQLRTVFD